MRAAEAVSTFSAGPTGGSPAPAQLIEIIAKTKHRPWADILVRRACVIPRALDRTVAIAHHALRHGHLVDHHADPGRRPGRVGRILDRAQ